MQDHPSDQKLTLLLFILTLFVGYAAPIVFHVSQRQFAPDRKTILPPLSDAIVTSDAPLNFDFLISSLALVEAGKKTYLTICVACHGERGDGNTDAGKALTPPPRSFIDHQAKWKKSPEAMDIYDMITHGSPGTGMMEFENILSLQQRWELVHYIQSLPGMQGRYHPITEENKTQIIAKLK